MSHCTLSDERQALRDSVRSFAERHVRPAAAKHDRDESYPAVIRRKAAEQGFVAPTVPTAFDGPGRDVRDALLIEEELWRADPGIGTALISADAGTRLIDHYGTRQQKSRWLPRIAAGEAVSAITITEPDHGTDVASIETTARRDGDEWVLDGTKTWVTNGSVADVLVVLAKTNTGAGHAGISTFLVPSDRPGIETETLAGTLGLRAADFAAVEFDAVRVPATNLVGEVDDGFSQLLTFLAAGRATVAAEALGAASAVVERVGEQIAAEDCPPSQRSQPSSDACSLDLRSSVAAARSLTYRAGHALSERPGEARSERLANMAKLYASETAIDVVDRGLELCGPDTGSTGPSLEKYYRDLRATTIIEGTSESIRSAIARQLLEG